MVVGGVWESGASGLVAGEVGDGGGVGGQAHLVEVPGGQRVTETGAAGFH